MGAQSTDHPPGAPPSADPVDRVLLELLEARRPAGWREYDLLQALRARGIGDFDRTDEPARLALFRRHHHLFHRLYGLRDRLRAGGRDDLEIHCLDIRLIANRPGEGTLPSVRDGLRDHYADLAQLDAIDEDAVDAMIGEGFARIAKRRDRARALGVLGLADPVSDRQVRARFHQLALENHPDRGGDLRRFQELSAAAASLR